MCSAITLMLLKEPVLIVPLGRNRNSHEHHWHPLRYVGHQQLGQGHVWPGYLPHMGQRYWGVSLVLLQEMIFKPFLPIHRCQTKTSGQSVLSHRITSLTAWVCALRPCFQRHLNLACERKWWWIWLGKEEEVVEKWSWISNYIYCQ